MKYSILFFFAILMFSNCNEASKPKENNADAPPEVKITALPSLPTSEFDSIFQTCDYIDYIFYELPISMSYDKKGTIQTALTWVDPDIPEPDLNCKPLGRMIFQKQGNIMMEAELFVSPECAYYLWIKDGKKAFNNKMTEKGLNHYLGIIKQFQN